MMTTVSYDMCEHVTEMDSNDVDWKITVPTPGGVGYPGYCDYCKEKILGTFPISVNYQWKHGILGMTPQHIYDEIAQKMRIAGKSITINHHPKIKRIL